MNDKAKQYSRIKDRVSIINLFLPFPLLLTLLLSGLSEGIAGLAYKFAGNFYVAVALYFLIVGVIFYIISFPLGFYSSFILEHKFGLSAQKLPDWIKDEAKEALISVAIFLPLIEIMYYVLRNFQNTWWIITAGVWIFFSIILSKLAPVLLIPLFFKYKPLEDEELKKRLLDLSEKTNTKIRGVFEIDMSKKTKKANAGLTGIGNTRRIILGDTLLNNFSHDEIEVVLAHEIAHHKLMHMWKLFMVGALSTVGGLYVAKLFLRWGANFFGFAGIYDIGAFPILALGITLFSLIILPLQNSYSRHLEKNADSFALETTKKPDAFISAMTKLAKQNLREETPNKFTEIVLYNHPTISKRLKMAENYKKVNIS